MAEGSYHSGVLFPRGIPGGEVGRIQGFTYWPMCGRGEVGGPAQGEAKEHPLITCRFYHAQTHTHLCLSFTICKMGVAIPVLSGGFVGLYKSKHVCEMGAVKQTQETGSGVPRRMSRAPAWCCVTMQLADTLLRCHHLGDESITNLYATRQIHIVSETMCPRHQVAQFMSLLFWGGGDWWDSNTLIWPQLWSAVWPCLTSGSLSFWVLKIELLM